MPQYISISRATWSHYENSKSQPPINGLIEIAGFFSISLDDLILKDLAATDPEGYKFLERKRSYKKHTAYLLSEARSGVEDFEQVYHLLQERITELEKKVEQLERIQMGGSL